MTVLSSPGKTPTLLHQLPGGDFVLFQGSDRIHLDPPEAARLAATLTTTTTPARARLISYPIQPSTANSSEPS